MKIKSNQSKPPLYTTHAVTYFLRRPANSLNWFWTSILESRPAAMRMRQKTTCPRKVLP